VKAGRLDVFALQDFDSGDEALGHA